MFRSARPRAAPADPLSKKPPSATEIRRLLRYVVPYRRYMLIASVGLVGGAALGLVFPWIMQNLVDAVLAQHNLAELNRITLILIGTFLVRAGLYYVQNYTLAYAGERIVVDLRREVYGRGLSALLLSNPCNPTGKLVQGEELTVSIHLSTYLRSAA
jgi:ABC-type multidrug transport system fused ATPase/permease subunit